MFPLVEATVSVVVPAADTTLVHFELKLLAKAFWLPSLLIRVLAELTESYLILCAGAAVAVVVFATTQLGHTEFIPIVPDPVIVPPVIGDDVAMLVTVPPLEGEVLVTVNVG